MTHGAQLIYRQRPLATGLSHRPGPFRPAAAILRLPALTLHYKP